MPQFQNKRRVRHSADKMFDLVADVEKYPQFVPLCKALRVRERTTNADGNEVIVADMTVSFKLIHERFTSRVTLDRAGRKITVEYLSGPFSKLDNRWTFEPQGNKEGDDACDVTFFIAYEFKSRMLGLVMGAMFDAAFQQFASAFEKRADQIYGRPSSVASS